MKYKVLKTSPLGKKLMLLHREMQVASKQADKLVKEFGGKKYCRATGAVAGGISAIEFEEKPKGWKKVGAKWQSLYMPMRNKKELWLKINALPLVDYEAINSILNFSRQTYCKKEGFYHVNCPGVLWRKDCILIEVQEELKYKPVAGMKEIMVSEFNKLEKSK
jgi:hypothetical protein